MCASVASAQLERTGDGRFLFWPSEPPPRPLAAREVKFPPYQMRTLRNGLQVIAVLHHEQPAVSMRLLVRAGSVQDPSGRMGVASLVASLLDQGTQTKSAQEIADHIDFIGGALATGSGSDLSYVNVVVMKDSFDVGMNLLVDVARHPAFAAEEIDRQKQQAISSLQVSSNDPDYVASVLLERLVYGFHPYGLPNSGTPETLASITRADLQQFHRRYFVPNNMILAIVGDVTSEEGFAAAERAFGDWPRAEVLPVTSVDPPPPTRRVVVIDKPDAVQTEIRVGQLAIPRKHDDYMAFDLAVKILGGEGANRLHRVLRSERGLTYGAQADTEARKQAGHVVAETDTRTETTGEALRLMVDEFARLQRDRVSQSELSDAQAYLAGSFPLTIETPGDIAAQVLNVVFYELPVEEIGTFRERVQAVRPDDIQRVARQYVRPDRLSIVLVGNASAFVPQLQRVGFTELEVIPIDQLDLMAATLKREGQRARSFDSFGTFGSFGSFLSRHTAYTPQQVNPRSDDPKALLHQIIEAKGGLDALKRIRTVVADEDRTIVTPNGRTPLPTKTSVIYPDKFRVDSLLAGQQIVHTYNSGAAWVKDLSGVSAAPPGMRDDFAATARRDTYPMLIAAAEGRLALRLLPEEGRDGQVLKVLEVSGTDFPPVRLYIDRDARIARQNYTALGPDGLPMKIEEVFSDYRSVDNVSVPFKASVLSNGRLIIERAITSVTFNTRIDEKLFDQPL
ncbi:MAG: insulinase family protein [Acidobacteria bacterium]|nr:insulinase family protein [Acidobacteriota bacterium]